MASFTLKDTRFPDGTVVGAYLATQFTAFPESGRPPGNPVTTATAGGQQVTFTGLEYGTRYFAAAEVSGSFQHYTFTTAERSEPQAWEEGVAAEAQAREAAVSAEQAARASADTAINSNIAIVKEAPINIEYPEYGAVGASEGAAADATAAIKKAYAALPSNGGEILIPRRYTVDEQLILDEKRSVKFLGQHGNGSGLTAPSELIFTQGSAAALISAKSTAGFAISNLKLSYTNASQTGPVIDLSHGTAASDSAYFLLDNVHISGSGIRTALGVSLDKAIIGTLRDCKISNCDVGLRGAAAAGGYANAITIRGGAFGGMNTMAIKNLGTACTIDGVQFNPLNNGKAGAYLGESGVITRGLSFRGVYCGDATVGEGTWITFRGLGLSINGGMIGSGDLGVEIPDSTSDGISIMGVNFWSMKRAIQANFGAGTQHYVIGGNAYEGVSGKKVSLDNGTTDAGAGFLSK